MIRVPLPPACQPTRHDPGGGDAAPSDRALPEPTGGRLPSPPAVATCPERRVCRASDAGPAQRQRSSTSKVRRQARGPESAPRASVARARARCTLPLEVATARAGRRPRARQVAKVTPQRTMRALPRCAQQRQRRRAERLRGIEECSEWFARGRWRERHRTGGSRRRT